MPPAADADRTVFRLYVAAGTPNSAAAEVNLRLGLERRTKACSVEIIDVLKEPDRALADGVLVTPTLMRVGRGRGAILIGRLEPLELILPFLQTD